MEDTIAAISSALGVGAISIIRLSGDKSIEIANKIFDRDISEVKTHTIHYGHIYNKEEFYEVAEVVFNEVKENEYGNRK